MDSSYVFSFVIMLFVVFVTTLVIFSNYEHQSLEYEAHKLIAFQDGNQTCPQLKTLYLEYKIKKYDSMNNVKWFNEIRKKLINNECISMEELNNREFIDICKDGKTIGCEISRIKNPQLYDNFKGIFPKDEIPNGTSVSQESKN